jgi:hypothetical protein
MATPLRDALELLGVAPGATLRDVRACYLRLLRENHPDVVGDTAGATERTAALTAAFATVRAAVLAAGGGVVPQPAPEPPPPPGSRGTAAGAASVAAWRLWRFEPVEADVVDHDTIAIGAPPAEAYALLLDAASEIGSIGYVDRRLGILEVMVRFEGGPTCSVLITLQGRAFSTEAFCTMESIEAAPTPPLRPVVEALVDALRRPPMPR